MGSEDRAARKIEVRILVGEIWWLIEMWVVVSCLGS